MYFINLINLRMTIDDVEMKDVSAVAEEAPPPEPFETISILQVSRSLRNTETAIFFGSQPFPLLLHMFMFGQLFCPSIDRVAFFYK